jgi:hypothetical protein
MGNIEIDTKDRPQHLRGYEILSDSEPQHKFDRFDAHYCIGLPLGLHLTTERVDDIGRQVYRRFARIQTRQLSVQILDMRLGRMHGRSTQMEKDRTIR